MPKIELRKTVAKPLGDPVRYWKVARARRRIRQGLESDPKALDAAVAGILRDLRLC